MVPIFICGIEFRFRTFNIFYSLNCFENIFVHFEFPDNIALHKPAYQEHPYGVKFPIVKELIQASNAVDGQKYNRSIWGGQCVISDNLQSNATWWVNLTSILSIHHITIYYRTGNVDWGKVYM